MEEGWPRYAELAREIDAVRSQEVARTAGMREAVAQMSQQADELEARLNGQRGMLTKLAGELKLRAPRFTPELPEGDVDPAMSLTTVSNSIDRGDVAARQAAERGQYAGLLPGLSTAARSMVVYGIAALIVAAVQIPQWLSLLDVGTGKTTADAGPDPILTLFIIPGIAFAIAYGILRIGARPRMDAGRGRPRTRWGFVLCFAVGPLGLLVFAAIGWRQG